MTYLTISVPIPTSRITYKKSSNPNSRYVYTVVKKYRNKQGTPTNKEVSIGKEDPGNPGYMFPNKNFETYYPLPTTSISKQPQATTVHNGASVFLETIAQKLGLDSALADTFGNQADKLLHTAIYMCLHGNVMHTIDFYSQEETLHSPYGKHYNKPNTPSQPLLTGFPKPACMVKKPR